jgi:hypothetical protein
MRADVVNGEDVRVIEHPRRTRFLLEAPHQIRRRGTGKNFDRDIAPDARIASAIHARADEREDLIGTELLARLEFHALRKDSVLTMSGWSRARRS